MDLRADSQSLGCFIDRKTTTTWDMCMWKHISMLPHDFDALALEGGALTVSSTCCRKWAAY